MLHFLILRLERNSFINFYQNHNSSGQPTFGKLVIQFQIKVQASKYNVYLIGYVFDIHGKIVNPDAPIEFIHLEEDGEKVFNPPIIFGNLEIKGEEFEKNIGPFLKPKGFGSIKFIPKQTSDYIGYELYAEDVEWEN